MTGAALNIVSFLFLGFFLGMRHATDADHVVAIATIVSRERSMAGSALIGAAWGAGHTITVMAVGTAIIVFGVVIPPRLGMSMEFAVGVMLVVLGVLTLTGMGRVARAAHAGQGENAKQDQHDADGKFHRHAEPRRNDDPEQDDCRTDCHDRDGVPDAPGGADQRRARHAALAADNRRNGDHMVGISCMPHPEEEPEKQEGHDVQGGSGHCARFKMASEPRNFRADTPNGTSACDSQSIRAIPIEGWGEP